MKQEQITQEIERLEAEAQKRINALAQQDPVWCNLQGQLATYKRFLTSKTYEVGSGEDV